MSGDRLVLLGVKGGPAIRPGSAMPTSNLLEIGGRKIVVDCGLGVTRGLCDAGMQLRDLSLVFVTHLHSDHYLELGPMLHTAWVAGLKTPVRVFGPPGLEDYWRNFTASMAADIDLRIEDEGRPDLRGLVSVGIVREGKFFDEAGLSVTAMRNLHPPLIDTFALSFEAGGKRIVFSGDTRHMPELSDFARGSDVLVHEAMLEEALPALMARIGNADGRLMKHWLRAHTTAADAARIAEAAGARMLVLSHLIPSDDPAYGEANWRQAVAGLYSGDFRLGRDGLSIEL